MIRELIYIVEIFSVLKCIHCVYGEKQKINIGYVMTVIALFVTVEIANRKSIELEGTFLMYTILSIYCILTFRKAAKVVVINTALYMIMSTLLQLLFGGTVTAIFEGDILLRTLIADIGVLMFCVFILPFLKPDKFALWASRKGYTLYISIGYVFLIVCVLLLRIKVNGGVRVGTYLTLIPFIFCFYILSKQWRLYQDSYEQEKRELQLYKEDKRKFDNMVSTVRSRQHEINNHITAIMSLHYTAETYEELVAMQNKYCNHIMEENKFHSLLKLYNSILPGFLIEKFSHIESKGVAVECRIFVEQYEPTIPEYYLIEMLGILLDNAVEAVDENTLDKRIYFAIVQIESEYEYIVRNPHNYVSYKDFESWFAYEKSSKGANRGIGLYHLKCLCNEWRCGITYSNVKIDNLNWVEFKVRTGRK